MWSCGGQGLWFHCTFTFSFPFGPRNTSAFSLSHFLGRFLLCSYPHLSEAGILSPTSVPPPSSGPRDLSLLLLPGDGGVMGADRAPVCAQPSKRTEEMSKHFTGAAKP